MIITGYRPNGLYPDVGGNYSWTMRLLLIIGLIIVWTSGQASSLSDSVKVDKKKIEKIIKKIKKSAMVRDAKYTIKDFDQDKIMFWYPDKIVVGQRLRLDVLHRGETILIYDINSVTYEFGPLIDLR